MLPAEEVPTTQDPYHRIKVRIMEPTEESFTEPWDLGPGNTFQKRRVSSPTAISKTNHQ